MYKYTVNLKLYDYNADTNRGNIPLPRLFSFQERVDYIKKNIFEINRYNQYYTQSKNRWLGIKVVNKPNKMENVKFTLDFIAGYLLNSREYTTHDDKKEYLELFEKDNIGELTSDERIRLLFLQGEVLYHKPVQSYRISKNMIFMKNRNYESLLNGILKLEINKDDTYNHTPVYCFNKTYDDWNDIIKIKRQLNDISSALTNLKNKKKNIKNDICNLMENVKDDNSTVSKIIDNSKMIKNINEKIGYANKKIRELYDDYLFVTEGKVSNY